MILNLDKKNYYEDLSYYFYSYLKKDNKTMFSSPLFSSNSINDVSNKFRKNLFKLDDDFNERSFINYLVQIKLKNRKKMNDIKILNYRNNLLSNRKVK